MTNKLPTMLNIAERASERARLLCSANRVPTLLLAKNLALSRTP